MATSVSPRFFSSNSGFLVTAKIIESNSINFSITLETYDSEISNFRAIELEISSDREESTAILDLQNVVEFQTGLKKTCILLAKSKNISQYQSTSLEILMLEEESRETFSFAKMQVDIPFKQISCSEETFSKLLDGPSICISSVKIVHFAFPDINTNKFIDKQFDIDNHLEESLKLIWSGWIDGHVVAMGTSVTSSSRDMSCSSWVVIDASDQTLLIQNADFLLPQLYSPLITCCIVLLCSVVGHIADMSESDFQFSFGASACLLVGTSKGQLIVFHRGKYLKHIQLPFNDPCRLLDSKTQDGRFIIFVQSSSGGACAVSFKKNKVISMWQNVGHVLQDDFLSNGSLQFLLIEKWESSLSDVSKIFKLVDSQFNTIIDKERTNQTAACESLSSAANALQARLQIGMSSVIEAKMEGEEKTRLVTQSLRNLHRLSRNESIDVQDIQNMVRLCDGIKKDKSPSESNPPDMALTVRRKWQRIIVDKLILGVEVKNNTNRIMKNVSLSLVLSGQNKSIANKLTSSSKLSGCASQLVASQHNRISSSDGQPSIKRPRISRNNENHQKEQTSSLPPGECTTVTAATLLPDFIEHSLHTYALLVTCMLPVERVCEGINTGVNVLEEVTEDGHVYCQNCGFETLRVEDVLSGSLKIGRDGFGLSREDDIAMKTVSLITEVLIHSRLTSFNNLIKIIHSGLEITVEHMNTDHEEKCAGQHLTGQHLSGHSSLFSDAKIQISFSSRLKEAKLCIYTRDRKQLHLLLHALVKILPDDVTVLPVADTIQHRNNSVVTMETELNKLKAHLASKLSTEIPSFESSDDGMDPRGVIEQNIQSRDSSESWFDLMDSMISTDYNLYLMLNE